MSMKRKNSRAGSIDQKSYSEVPLIQNDCNDCMYWNYCADDLGQNETIDEEETEEVAPETILEEIEQEE